MQKLTDYYNNLDIESKARLQGFGGAIVIYITFNVIAYFL